MQSVILTSDTFGAGLEALTSRDPDLAAAYARWGTPPLWAREPGFATLVKIILEQQVSLASAQATFDRLTRTVDPLTPGGVLALDDDTLRSLGFSRQKTRYVRHLADALVAGTLDLAALAAQDDNSVRHELIKLKGIGPWSAEIYLLMALRRSDAWPAGDLGLQVAAQEIKGLAARPDAAALHDLAEGWRPWRAVAARLLWHHYLSKAGSSSAPV